MSVWSVVRQVSRQIELFLEDGVREHLVVALTLLDGEAVPAHQLEPDGRGQGMRRCAACGETEPEGTCVAPDPGVKELFRPDPTVVKGESLGERIRRGQQ